MKNESFAIHKTHVLKTDDWSFTSRNYFSAYNV